MKHSFAVTILILMVLAAGCGQAKQVKVTYRSDPPGGTLYKDNGEVWGQCPKVLWYDLDEEAHEKGYLEAKNLAVRWPRGAEKTSTGLIKITVNGTDRMVTFTQPRLAASSAAMPAD